MTARQIGISACILAVMLLGLSLFAGRKAEGATASPQAAATQTITATDAWIRLPAVSGRPAGGFLTITGGAEDDELVSVKSPLAERIELHSMVDDKGIMRMRHEKSFTIPAGEKFSLAPGGNHLMFFGLRPDVQIGVRVPLILGFKSGAYVEVAAVVRNPGATSGAHHQH